MASVLSFCDNGQLVPRLLCTGLQLLLLVVAALAPPLPMSGHLAGYRLVLDQLVRPHEPPARPLEAPEELCGAVEALAEGDGGLQHGQLLHVLVVRAGLGPVPRLSRVLVAVVAESVLGVGLRRQPRHGGGLQRE